MMAIQFRPFLLITLSSFIILFSLLSVSMAVDIKPGEVASQDGYIALKPTDQDAADAAQFAVEDYNKMHKKSAKLIGVDKAAGQKYGGDKYEFALVINVEEDNTTYTYSATVVDEDGARRLVVFRRN